MADGGMEPQTRARSKPDEQLCAAIDSTQAERLHLASSAPGADLGIDASAALFGEDTRPNWS
jgi:hypothetical protein